LLYVKNQHQQKHQEPLSDSSGESEAPLNLEEDKVDDESEELEPVDSPPQVAMRKLKSVPCHKLKQE